MEDNKYKYKLGFYRHYKGGTVKVIDIALHSETKEEYVVYECFYECKDHGKGSMWVRPAEMFFEKIEVNGRIVERFKYIENIK